MRRARVRSNLSQAELARRLGVSRASVSIWESGGNISQNNIFKLAESLGVTPEWLQYGVESDSQVDVRLLTRCLERAQDAAHKKSTRLSPAQMAHLAAYLYAEEMRGVKTVEPRVADLVSMLTFGK